MASDFACGGPLPTGDRRAMRPANRTRRRARAIGALGGFVYVLGLATWGAQAAFAECNPAQVDPSRAGQPPQYSWVSTQKSVVGSAVTQVEGQIETYYPYVSTGGFSYAWVMLVGPGGTFKWAQIGPYEVANNVRSVQIQTANGTASSIWVLDLAARPNGSDDVYKIAKIGPSLYRFYINGGSVAVKSLTWTADGAQVSAETTDLGTQMMGAFQNSVHFVGHRYYLNNAWHTNWDPVNVTRPQYHDFAGGNTNFYTWDKACVL